MREMTRGLNVGELVETATERALATSTDAARDKARLLDLRAALQLDSLARELEK